MGRLSTAGQNRRVMFLYAQLLTDNKRLVTMINDWGSLSLLPELHCTTLKADKVGKKCCGREAQRRATVQWNGKHLFKSVQYLREKRHDTMLEPETRRSRVMSLKLQNCNVQLTADKRGKISYTDAFLSAGLWDYYLWHSRQYGQKSITFTRFLLLPWAKVMPLLIGHTTEYRTNTLHLSYTLVIMLHNHVLWKTYFMKK